MILFYQSIHLSNLSLCLSACLSVCLSVYPSVRLSVLSVCLSMCLSYLSLCLSVYIFLYQSVKVIYCNKFAGSVSRWNFITLKLNTQLLNTVHNTSRILTHV
jgi:hypothetical protein